jgi:hypothetical protein
MLWLINASCACVQTLDYIDYDTKMFTYDAFVPKAYMVGSMNSQYDMLRVLCSGNLLCR